MFKTLFADCLLVNDFNKSLDFYTNKLGLEINEQDNKFASFKLDGTSLAIFEKSEAVEMFPRSYMKAGGGIVLGFQVENVQESCKKLMESGVDIFEGPKTTAWGQTVAYFNDPDGNIYEISNKNT